MTLPGIPSAISGIKEDNKKMFDLIQSLDRRINGLSEKMATGYVSMSRFEKIEAKLEDLIKENKDSIQRLHTERETGDAGLHERINEMKDKLADMKTQCASKHLAS